MGNQKEWEFIFEDSENSNCVLQSNYAHLRQTYYFASNYRYLMKSVKFIGKDVGVWRIKKLK